MLDSNSNVEFKKNPDANNDIETASKYLQSAFENTYYLGYRDIPALIKKYNLNGKKALDYGCGTGRSTRFLKSLGFETLGVDTCKVMLSQTLKNEDSQHYLHIKNAEIPVVDGSYEFAFSCFVFFTVSSKNELDLIFKEIYRCLKAGGIFIVVTGSEELYLRDWLSYNVNFPQNQSLKSGDRARIQLKDLGIEFPNYFWTDKDYNEIFNNSNFRLLEKHFPKGTPEDSRNWLSESQYSPYVVYVLQKPSST